MKRFKLSFVTSCYNAEAYLEELADSVFFQNYDHWEWILADDFSVDNTRTLMEKLKRKDSRIRIVEPKHKKEIWWNPQIHAVGEIVCHLDADDAILPGTFEKIIHYFNLFPEAVLLHFNANKYFDVLPQNSTNLFDKFKDNVYMTRDNDSFLEGFEKLWPQRSNIFGYLRIFKNLPGLRFPEHEDGDACLSNDGQWLLHLERYGKWLTVPRTTYLAREHGECENFRNWNPRGEAQLVINERKDRSDFILEYPRNIKYFDDIYDLAESTYLSKLNYETERKLICFLNFDYTQEQISKVKHLFFDHDIVFDKFIENISYYFVKINLEDTPETIKTVISRLPLANFELNFFSDNVHLHQNNRNQSDNIENIKEVIVSQSQNVFWYAQDNRIHFISNFQRIHNVPEIVLSAHNEYIPNREEKNEKNLKIMQIHVGCGLEIPPKGYGGLEEVIYQYTRVAEKRGHEVSLKWLDDITQNDLEKYDVFHNHTGGFWNLLRDRCIPYIFTMHDAFVKIHGKDSHFYMTNNETIKNSLFSLIPSEDMIDFFLYPEKLRRLHHGVDTNFFYPNENKKDIRLICVGGGDDRKGFHLAVQAAKILGFPITIVGPDSIHAVYNKTFYDIVEECKEHIDINLTGNVGKDELRNLLNEHHVMIHPASLETGQPCLAVLEAMACGLPVVGTMQDKLSLKGFELCTRDVDDIVNKVKLVLDNYDEYSKKAREFAQERDWENIFDELEKYYYEAKELKYTKPFDMKDRLLFAYKNTNREGKNVFDLNMQKNPYLSIRGNVPITYKINFIDRDTGMVHYSNEVSVGGWVACGIDYYVNWRIEAINVETEEIEFEYEQDFTNKNIFIWFDSVALGDTLAWLPVVEEFRKKHNCKMYCSTFWNDLISESYPEITFIIPESGFEDFVSSYRIGFFEESPQSPVDMKGVSLQNLCAGILDIKDFKETRCKINVKEEVDPELIADLETNPVTGRVKPYVCIGMQSTAQAKYWNYPGGWDKVVDFLSKKGYNVVCIDKFQSFGQGEYFNVSPKKVIGRHERTIDQTIATLNGAEFFIGLGSGLSWLAWTLNKYVIMISGFSNPGSEFSSKCIRLHDDTVCNSCYNRHKFDPSDWLWCPDHKNTDRMFECTKNIKPAKVCDAIEEVIKVINNND
jgi:autotransporter strand-loop-strand O-heptosyltransferase